jgi:lysophospholipid hydrolase
MEGFWHRALPFRRNLDVSSVLGIVLRVPSLVSANRTEEIKHSVDLYLGPPIDDFGMLEFERMDELVEIGYA